MSASLAFQTNLTDHIQLELSVIYRQTTNSLTKVGSKINVAVVGFVVDLCKKLLTKQINFAWCINFYLYWEYVNMQQDSEQSLKMWQKMTNERQQTMSVCHESLIDNSCLRNVCSRGRMKKYTFKYFV